jgi:hypothetical protein
MMDAAEVRAGARDGAFGENRRGLGPHRALVENEQRLKQQYGTWNVRSIRESPSQARNGEGLMSVAWPPRPCIERNGAIAHSHNMKRTH